MYIKNQMDRQMRALAYILAMHQPNANVTYRAKRMQSRLKLVTKCYLTTGIDQIEMHQQKSTPY